MTKRPSITKKNSSIVIVLVPVILALNDAEADDGSVHLAERLVVPAVGTGRDELRKVDHFERRVANVER